MTSCFHFRFWRCSFSPQYSHYLIDCNIRANWWFIQDNAKSGWNRVFWGKEIVRDLMFVGGKSGRKWVLVLGGIQFGQGSVLEYWGTHPRWIVFWLAKGASLLWREWLRVEVSVKEAWGNQGGGWESGGANGVYLWKMRKKMRVGGLGMSWTNHATRERHSKSFDLE
jgi:hypothetical protein